MWVGGTVFDPSLRPEWGPGREQCTCVHLGISQHVRQRRFGAEGITRNKSQLGWRAREISGFLSWFAYSVTSGESLSSLGFSFPSCQKRDLESMIVATGPFPLLATTSGTVFLGVRPPCLISSHVTTAVSFGLAPGSNSGSGSYSLSAWLLWG